MLVGAGSWLFNYYYYKIMNRLLQNGLLLVFCFGVGVLYACSKNSEIPQGNDNILLVSTDPEENAVISPETASITFVFNKGIYIVDVTKIRLNGISKPNTTVYGTVMTVKTGSLKSDTEYELIIEKGAIRDGSNNLNNNPFSLKFKTKEAPLEEDPPETPLNGTSVSENGFLFVEGTSLINEKGQPVILHGASFGWHNWWPRFYNENTVSWLKEEWKCDVVRAAIGVEPDGAYISNPTLALNCLYAVVDAAIKNDMYVIIDWHSHSIKLNEAKAFFQLVAEKYKDYPNIIYEIFNEPQGIDWSNVKAYSEEVIKTIRSIDKKNIILVGTPTWSQDVDVAANDPVTGYDNLMYVLHFYAATHKQYLRDKANTALQKGLPVFVSECAGMEASGDGPINKQEWQAWIQWMNEHNISWIAWSVTDKDETCSMIKNTSSPVSGWKNSDLKEWGQIVREELKKYINQ